MAKRTWKRECANHPGVKENLYYVYTRKPVVTHGELWCEDCRKEMLHEVPGYERSMHAVRPEDNTEEAGIEADELQKQEQQIEMQSV